MNKFVIILFGVLLLLSSPITAKISDKILLESIKRAGLKAIPEDATLMKLIDPNGLITGKRVALGKKLYYDTRLSKTQTVSCASCHDLKAGGADGIAVAIGVEGKLNPFHLNSPTVYNSVFFEVQFWDGRSPSLEDQAQGPMLAPFEMNMTPGLVEKRINSVPEYVKLFEEAYNKNVIINFAKIADTIAIFERTLFTPSRFDDYINRQRDALTEAEKEGLLLLIDRGCTNCHTDTALGGSMQPFGITDDFKFMNIGTFTGNKDGFVKVPSLRNVTLNSPYFHNGTIDKLEDAIREMSRIQLSITEIEDYEIDSLVVFLKSLEGRKPDITLPDIPK